jgi:hypothetical protein
MRGPLGRHVRGRSIQPAPSNPKATGRWWPSIVGALLVLAVLWGNYWLNARALRQRLAVMGGSPGDAPLQVVNQYVREGMAASAVTANMPKPDRLEFYLIRIAGTADSLLVTRYIYRLATTDWPVDIYYGARGLVVDVWAADNPSLVSARRLTKSEAGPHLAF